MLSIEQTNQKNEKLKTLEHHCMAMVGGFMGGYAILTRGDFLGNAQTANLIFLVHALLGRDVWHVLLRLIAVFLYILGTMSYVMIKNKTSWNVQAVSCGVDIAAVILVGFIPMTVDPVVALFPIFFAMSLQWNAFPGNYGYVSSTIFSTNNVKQSTLAFSEYLCDKNKKHLHKMKFFLGSLFFFHLGVIVSYFSTDWFAEKGIWLNLIVLFVAAVFIWQDAYGKIREKATDYAMVKG